jgi:hypothetical protein
MLHSSTATKARRSASGRALKAAAIPGSGATTVTVTDITDQRVFQRVGSSASIAVTGTFTGPAAVIQARAVPNGTSISSTAVAWQTLVATPTGGTYSGNLTVAQGGWYNIQVRDAVSYASAGGSSKFGVGVVIGVIGQSNAVGLIDNVQSYPLGGAKSVEYVAGAYRRVGNVNDAYSVNTLYPAYGGYTTPGHNADGYTFLANLVSSGLAVPVCLMPYAVSGSAIASWMSGQANWTQFAAAIASVGDMEAVIWHQGESDANLMSTATMKLRLSDLHTQLLSVTGRTTSNFNFGVVSLGPGSFSGSSEGEFGNMRTAHTEYANSTAGAFLAGCAHDTQTSDGVHITGEGQSRLGRRYAKALLGKLGIGAASAGPKITGATRSGAIITVAIAHTGGTALSDGSGGSGAALTGWQVYDGGVLASIASTAIVGNTVQLTLSATPSGVVEVAYAMMDAPHGTATSFVSVSCVYDNDTYLNSSTGLPLQPAPRMVVA